MPGRFSPTRRHKGGRAGRVFVVNGNDGRARVRKGMGHRGASPASPDQQNICTRRTGQPLSHAFGKSPQVRVVSMSFAIAKNDCIDRANRAGIP